MGILIVTPVTYNWQTFATWYSVHKNLPRAEVVIKVVRGKETPFQLFQWAKRLEIPLTHTSRKFEDEFSNLLSAAIEIPTLERRPNLLILTPQTMVIRPFEEPESEFLSSEYAIFCKGTKYLESYINARQLNNLEYNDQQKILCQEAKDSDEPLSIVSYKKGCGKWIDTLKGCPFSNAAGLATEDMTTNERRIIEMWKDAVPLYNATA